MCANPSFYRCSLDGELINLRNFSLHRPRYASDLFRLRCVWTHGTPSRTREDNLQLSSADLLHPLQDFLLNLSSIPPERFRSQEKGLDALPQRGHALSDFLQQSPTSKIRLLYFQFSNH